MNELQQLASAFFKQQMRYTFTASEHPSTPGIYRFVFSRPTNAAPESAVYVTVDITKDKEQDDVANPRYCAAIEGLSWPYCFRLRNGLVDSGGFPESLLEKVDMQKCKVNNLCLWK
uniref:Uncharacterized protein n=1 Tax=Trypanosoma vivax (strain Y486) TaxID=1055687 RepID=G0TW78_TRYVY|nr:conserved hypothetical protein [Trypanosoma vivax Y486]